MLAQTLSGKDHCKYSTLFNKKNKIMLIFSIED